MSGPLTRRRLGALWSTLFWAAVGVGSYVLGVLSPLGQEAEASVLGAAEYTEDPPAPLNLVSVPGVGIALLVIALIALWAYGIRRALVVLVVSAVALVASQLLKLKVLDRPELFELDAPNTFPSGHMTVFVVLVAALIWAVPAVIRWIVAFGGAALIGAVGWQLLAYGWHRPSDVLGAIALGAGVFAAASVIRPATAKGPVALRRITSIGLALVGWALVGGALILVAIAASSNNAGMMLNAGQLGSVGLSAVAARTIFRLCSSRSA